MPNVISQELELQIIEAIVLSMIQNFKLLEQRTEKQKEKVCMEWDRWMIFDTGQHDFTLNR